MLVPLRDQRYDLDGLLEAITPRTKLVCIAHPNNPTGTSNGRDELLRFLDRVPEHVLTVLDQAYFEYVTDPDYLDGVEEAVKQGRRVLVLRTFSKLFGLAGLRIGYGIGPADVVAGLGKVRRPFDLSTPAQAMALASLDDPDEVARRRRLNEEGRGALEQALRDGGFEVAGPAVANFVYADVGGDARPLFEALLRLGVIVRPLARLRRARSDPRQRGHARGDGDLRRGPRARASRGGVIRTGLLGRAPAFRLLFLATLGSGIGTMLAVIALTVDVYERTGSGAWVSAVLVADFVPTIAIGLLLGPLVDRLSRRWLMVGADLVRLAAFVALPFAPSAGAIVALALVVGFANGFFRPAAYAGMPNLVDRADLARANSLFQATDNLTWLLGPLLGGVLLAAYGPDVPYLVNAATFALSAVLVLRIPARLLASEEPLSRGHWRDLAEGFGVVFRSRALLTVLVVVDDRDGRERGGERGGGLPRAGVVRRRATSSSGS